MSNIEEYRAIVGKIVRGRHGPYVVSYNTVLGTVTFALSPEVWQEGEHPSSGTYVVLSDIQKKQSGWRAQKARFLRPSDEQPKQPAER